MVATAPVTDPFALLADADIEKNRRVVATVSLDDIPANVRAKLVKLAESPGSHIDLPVIDESAIDSITGAVAAVGNHTNTSGSVRKRHSDKEKTQLVGVRISFGERRGRKVTDASDTSVTV